MVYRFTTRRIGMAVFGAAVVALGITALTGQSSAVQGTARVRGNVAVVSDQNARSGILCIRPPAAAMAHRSLLDAGITCALREGAIRISPHFYNTIEDVDRLIDVLDSSLQ